MSDAPNQPRPLNKLPDRSVENINSFLRPSWDFSCISKVCLYDTRTREKVHSIPVDSPVVDVACSSRFLAIALQNNKILFYKDLDGDYDGHDARFREKLDAELALSQEFSFGEFDTKNRRTIIFSPLGTTFAVHVYRNNNYPSIQVYRLEDNSAGNYSFEPVVEYPNCYEMVYTSDVCLAVVNARNTLTYNYFNTKVYEFYPLSRHRVEFVECFDNRVVVGTKNAEDRDCIVAIKDGVRIDYVIGFPALCAIGVDEFKIALGGPDFIRELDFDNDEVGGQPELGERMRIVSGYHGIFKLPNGSDEEFIIGTQEGFHWCNHEYNTKDTTEFPCQRFCGAVVEEVGETLMVVSGYSPPVRKAIEELIKMEIRTGDRYMLREGDKHVCIARVWDFIINTLTTYKSMFRKEGDWKNIINRGKDRVDKEWRMYDKDRIIYQAAGHGAFKVMSVLVYTLDADVDDRCIFNLLKNIEETLPEQERVQRYLACIRLCMSIKPKVTLGKQILFQDWGPVNFDVISYAVYVCAEDALKELLNTTEISINLPRALFAAVSSGDFFSRYEHRYKSMIKSILGNGRCDVNRMGMVGMTFLTPISYVIKEYVDGATELENLAMLLVDHGALNMGGSEPYSPFVYAINKGMVGLIEHWVDKDAEILDSVVSDRLPFLEQLADQAQTNPKARKMLDLLTKKPKAGSGAPKESELMNNIILRF